MDLTWACSQLEANGARIVSMLQHVSLDHARWRPDPASWSMIEVINHLYDEEREDFRLRIDLTLHKPDTEWPPIDTQGWVSARAYQERDLASSLANFQTERAHSLVWLRGLSNPDWTIARAHPSGFVLRSGDLLAAWVAHDLLHLRQLVELHYSYVAQTVKPYEVLYAGDW